MENVVHNPAELGEIAGKTRAELGLRLSDLHAYTKLNPRFIGEVEHGKATAQIGKVMQMLESIGLEMVIRPQTRELMANPHTLGLSKGRFWSSGNQLPATRIIARVLADPVEADLVKLKQHFGIGLILATWKRLTERGDIAESVVPTTKMMLRKLVTAS